MCLLISKLMTSSDLIPKWRSQRFLPAVQYGVSQDGTIQNVNSLDAFRAFDRQAAAHQASLHAMLRSFDVATLQHGIYIDLNMIPCCACRLRSRSGRISTAAKRWSNRLPSTASCC